MLSQDFPSPPKDGAVSRSDFDHEIAAIRRRCASLARDTPDSTGTLYLLNGSLEELAASLEALQSAAEALRTQNGALAQTRATLEVERLRSRDLFESAPEACLLTDASGTIHEANRQAHALLQAGPRSLVGNTLAKFVPLEDRRAFQSFLRDGSLDGQMAREPKTGEMRLIPCGRTPAPLDVAVAVSKVQEATGLCRWWIRPLALQRELERCRTLVAEVKDYAIILTDRQGWILDWNRGAEQILGYGADEALGKPLDLIFTPEDRAQGIAPLERKQAERDGRADDDRWLVRKDGSRFWAGGSVMPLYGEGQREVRWFAKVLQDRTGQRRSEEEAAGRLRHASRIADTFQQALVPETPIRSFPRLLVATRYESAWEEARVGGDFYDACPLSNGLVALTVGDVSGKGLGAAMRAGEIKTALCVITREEPDPAAAMARVNAFVCDHARLDGTSDYLYATLTLAVLDPETGALAVALAGADPVLILRRDGNVETCGTPGVLLGLGPRQAYQAASTTLEPGDRLLMVTDGLTEARCPKFSSALAEEAFFGMTGVTQYATQLSPSLSISDLCAGVVQAAHDFAGGRLTDDACVLAAERR